MFWNCSVQWSFWQVEPNWQLSLGCRFFWTMKRMKSFFKTLSPLLLFSFTVFFCFSYSQFDISSLSSPHLYFWGRFLFQRVDKKNAECVNDISNGFMFDTLECFLSLPPSLFFFPSPFPSLLSSFFYCNLNFYSRFWFSDVCLLSWVFCKRGKGRERERKKE